MQYPVESKRIKLLYDPEALALEIHVEGSEVVWQWADGGKLLPVEGVSKRAYRISRS